MPYIGFSWGFYTVKRYNKFFFFSESENFFEGVGLVRNFGVVFLESHISYME